MILSLTYLHWLAYAAVLIISEVMVGGGFLLWVGIAAFIMAGVSFCFPALTTNMQLLLFGIAVVFNTGLWWHFWRKKIHASDQPHLNRRGERYLNQVFTLCEPIVNGRGKIKVGDTSWIVEGPDLPLGSQVRVIQVDGTIFKVRSE